MIQSACTCLVKTQRAPLKHLAQHKTKHSQILEGVKFRTTFTTWGNSDENLLNVLIIVKKLNLEGKKLNLLLWK